MFLKVSKNSQGNTCARVKLFNKVAGGVCNFIKKESQALVFFREFWEIFRSTFFAEHFWTNATKFYVNHLLALQICKPTRKPHVSKEFIHKISTNAKNFAVYSFSWTQKTSFLQTYVFANQTKVFISLTLSFISYAKTFIWQPISFCKNGKNLQNLR